MQTQNPHLAMQTRNPHFAMHHRHIACAAFLLLFTLYSSLFLPAQQVARPALPGGTTSVSSTTATTLTTAAATSATGAAAPIQNPESKIQNPTDEVVELSVFQVTGSQDRGYQGLNTTSGSRVRTDLRDVAASISPFSDEFLSDVAATTLDDMLAYAGNVEMGEDDNSSEFNSNNSRRAGNTNNAFRIRGISANVSANYVRTGVPQDLYNIGRSEIASGANSILFGMGSQGGILSLTSKTANAQRTLLSVKYTAGTWTSPVVTGIPYQRATFDYNLVLKPRALGFRLLALWQDGGNQSWRKFVDNTQKRINPLIYIKPFKNTTINLGYEGGSQHDSPYYSWNANDALTSWIANGRQTMTGFGAANAVPGTTQINTANPDYVFNDDNRTMYNFRSAYQSQSGLSNANTDSSQNFSARLPDYMSSYYYNLVGPSGQRSQNFETWSAVIQQNLGPLSLELAYYHNNNKSTSHTPAGTDVGLRGDPNAYVSPANWGGNTPDNVLPNVDLNGTPYAGRLYMEQNWQASYLNQRNDVYRLTADYNLNLKKYGTHRIIALIERSENATYSNLADEILVDNNQQAINNITSPADATNQITRRHYVTEGDFSTYYPGDWRTPIDTIVVNNKTYHNAYVTDNANLSKVQAAFNSFGLTLQSLWFDNKLSTIIGGRVDDVNYKRGHRARVTDPNDPRILDKSNIYYEYAFDGTWDAPRHYLPYTLSAGAVYHITNRLSIFANYSTNRGTPYLDSRTVLPTGDLPDLSKGRSTDYGIMLDIMGDGKWFVRATRFDTRQYNDPAIAMNTANASNTVLASNYMFNIYDALYFLTPTSQTALPPATGWPAGSGPDAGPGRAGNQWGWQYATVPASASQPWGTPPQYNSATVDVISKGYELELTGNPAKNITLRFTFSYSDRQRTNVMPEIFDFYNKNIPIWLAMADPNHNGGYAPDGVTPAYIVNSVNANNGNITQSSLYNYIEGQLFPYSPEHPYGNINGNDVRDYLLIQLLRQSGAAAARPYKFNLTGKYNFPKGPLKGFALGGAVRYQSPNLMVDPSRARPDLGADNPLGIDYDAYVNGSKATMIKGTSLTFWDAFLIYKCKLFGGKTTATFQFNIMNIFNQNVITGGRTLMATDTDGNISAVVRRTYLSPPRTYRLSAQFDF